MWLIGVQVEQETSAPPPKKNPGSAPGNLVASLTVTGCCLLKKTDDVYAWHNHDSVPLILILISEA